MMYRFTAAALLAAVVAADNCSQDVVGNWYCDQVNAISYTDVGSNSQLSYNKVTSMDSSSGACSSTPFGYSGPVSPLNEEVSMHFRGPLALKQFAFYTPSSSGNSRRDAPARRHAHGYGHAHLHQKREPSPAEEKRQVGAVVSAVIDGVMVSWINEWSGLETPAPSAAATVTSAPAAAAAAATASVDASSAANSWGSDGTPANGWTREAYYNAESGTSEGLVFLNHMGGQGSGVFDYKFGNSLSYASADGTVGSASPQVLADTTLSSSEEVVIMSNTPCGAEDGDCGYYRDGTVAYHGFGGANKAFFFEFGMPNDGNYNYDAYSPVNMPAIWMLNAQIPRTVQYGPADCSCWTSGCGEFDIFEVLYPGETRCKSTLHGNRQGGDSNYFARPVSGTMKAVVIMTDNDIHIKVLDNSADFGADLIENTLSSIISDTMAAVSGVSLFSLNK